MITLMPNLRQMDAPLRQMIGLLSLDWTDPGTMEDSSMVINVEHC